MLTCVLLAGTSGGDYKGLQGHRGEASLEVPCESSKFRLWWWLHKFLYLLKRFKWTLEWILGYTNCISIKYIPFKKAEREMRLRMKAETTLFGQEQRWMATPGFHDSLGLGSRSPFSGHSSKHGNRWHPSYQSCSRPLSKKCISTWQLISFCRMCVRWSDI